MREVFAKWKEEPVHACSGCGMPEKDYHTYNRKDKTCTHAENMWPLIFCILRERKYKDAIAALYPEVMTSGIAQRQWLLRDVQRKGYNGVALIVEWWLVDVCGRDLE